MQSHKRENRARQAKLKTIKYKSKPGNHKNTAKLLQILQETKDLNVNSTNQTHHNMKLFFIKCSHTDFN